MKRLGDFLGFDDESVSDVLDHLLTIESEDDLLDYLSQLLGSRSDEIKEFVKDIGRFRQGLPIEGRVQQEDAVESKPVAKPAPSPSPTNMATKQIKQGKKAIEQKTKAKPAAASTKSQPSSPPSKIAAAAGKANKAKETNKQQELEAKNASSPKETDENVKGESKEKSPPKKKYGLPPKGEAQRICGCFGTLHKPLTNCLYCGRISCAEEGYDFCPYCGYLVEEVKRPEGEPNRCVVLWFYRNVSYGIGDILVHVSQLTLPVQILVFPLVLRQRRGSTKSDCFDMIASLRSVL